MGMSINEVHLFYYLREQSWENILNNPLNLLRRLPS